MPSNTGRPTTHGASLSNTIARIILFVQGPYFVLTGLWPLVSLETFLAVTGPKETLWLVQTVGALVLAIGLVLLLAVRQRHVTVEVRALGGLTALAFLIIDLTIVLQGRAPPVYLLDALVQLILLIGWCVAMALSLRGAQRAAAA